MASVKVAVRVRPFNKREVAMNEKLIVQMDGKRTRIFNTKVDEIACTLPSFSSSKSTESHLFLLFYLLHV
ncbi:unnamed protein product [Lasius platythorax]|uniref:Kinesin motor domain-containing protein n=1 Tax=Lasius platythorax TaxID=488582 RepID=A0AAV2NJA3_9HYME